MKALGSLPSAFVFKPIELLHLILVITLILLSYKRVNPIPKVPILLKLLLCAAPNALPQYCSKITKLA